MPPMLHAHLCMCVGVSTLRACSSHLAANRNRSGVVSDQGSSYSYIYRGSLYTYIPIATYLINSLIILLVS